MRRCRVSKRPDVHIRFSGTENSGVLIQYKHCRALFFVRGITLDSIFFDVETETERLKQWVESKRRLYLSQTQGGESKTEERWTER